MKVLIVVLIAVVSIGCSSSGKAFLKTDDMPTMKEVYDKKFSHSKNTKDNHNERPIENGTKGLQGDIKHHYDNLSEEFQFLPNPTLTMYIYFHLTDAGTPIPGYSTFFKFYENDHVALPNEITFQQYPD